MIFLLASRLFSFGSEARGTIEFKGNMLFTHFSEINSPTIGSPTEMASPGLPEALSQNEFPDETLNSGKI